MLHRRARVRRLRPRDLVAVLEISLITAAVHVALPRVPLPRLARWCGVRLAARETASDAASAPTPLTDAQTARLRVARRFEDRGAGGEGTCLRNALVAGHVLRRHRPRLYVGARLQGSDVVAHAWLEMESTTIGYLPGFTPLLAGRRR